MPRTPTITRSTSRKSIAFRIWRRGWSGPRKPHGASCRPTPGGTRLCSTNSKEKTGYPTQKPLGILNRIISASSNPGDLVMDFFAGSGTTGASCLELGRRFILIDDNLQALQVMAKRFAANPEIEWIGFNPAEPQ
ncbi:MAG: site-specific DNA-methyltransferase [Anaerolineales bacterium]|nr:site-specific DNA-methyltransferase [Anaerolineales bacterium]